MPIRAVKGLSQPGHLRKYREIIEFKSCDLAGRAGVSSQSFKDTVQSCLYFLFWALGYKSQVDDAAQAACH